MPLAQIHLMKQGPKRYVSRLTAVANTVVRRTGGRESGIYGSARAELAPAIYRRLIRLP